jgi:hypothetical protein
MATYKDALLRSVNVEKPVTDPSAIHQIEQTVPFLHALAIQKPKGDIPSFDFPIGTTICLPFIPVL